MLRINATGIKQLGRAFRKIGVDVRTKGLRKPLNSAGDAVSRRTKRKLQQWSGLRRSSLIGSAMKRRRAHAGRLMFTIEVRSPWFAVTPENFGAKWSRAMPGVAHEAWQGGNVERGSFMAHGRAYHRTSKSRYPIKTLWGSNIAREMERHKPEMRVMAGHAVRRTMIPRVVHNMDRSVKSAKATFGL